MADGGSTVIKFATGGNTERARIDSSGRLLVGTATSVSNVYVASSAFQQTVQVATATNSYANGFTALNYSAVGYASVLTLGLSKNNTLGSDTAISSGDDLGIINFVGNDGTNFRSGAFITATCDGAVSTGDLPTRLVFSTTADGASSPTERMRITSTGQMRLAGAGITFNGDTATANELDDYEEGTFSPTLQGLSVAGAIGYVRNNGRYTKVGNIVHIAVDIKVDAISVVPTGGLVFASLPFTSANVEGNFAYPGAVRLNGVSLPAGSLGAYAIMLNNSTLARIQTLIDNAAPGSIDGSNLATNDELQWSCTYRTA
jgi:hypothetical protein